MPIPIADMRIRADTNAYITKAVNFPSGLVKVDGASLMRKAVTVASSSTTNIASIDGDFVDVSGNATITALGTVSAGAMREVRFTGAPTLTYNATSLILPTAASIVATAGDTATFRSLGVGNWVCTRYQRADGSTMAQGAVFDTISTTANNFGSTASYTTTTSRLCLTIGASGVHLTGLLGGSGLSPTANRRLILSVGVASADVLHIDAESGGSTAANRFNFAFDVQIGESIVLVYDSVSSRWTMEPVDTLAGKLKLSNTALRFKGVDIASASTTNIAAATGDFVDVTGTTTITALGTAAAGAMRVVRFTGALTLTHNATSLILPTGTSIPVEAGDVAKFHSLGSGNWKCTGYLRANGTPLSPGLLTTSVSTSQNDYAPSGYGAGTTQIVVTATGTAALTGLTGGTANRVITIFNSYASAVPLYINDQNIGSIAANRFNTGLSNGIGPGTSARFRYNASTSRWNCEEASRFSVFDPYGRTKVNPGELIITSDDGVTAKFNFNWEDGLVLSTPVNVGSLFAVAADGSFYVPLRHAILSPTQLTASVNDYANWTTFTRLTSNASWNITGLSRPGTEAYAVQIVLANVGTNNIVLKHESASSTTYNRFSSISAADITLAGGELAFAVYDPTTQRWRVGKSKLYNQSLNTTDSPTFANLILTSLIGDTAGFKCDEEGIRSAARIGCAEDNVTAGLDSAYFNFEGLRVANVFLTDFDPGIKPVNAAPATTGTMTLTIGGTFAGGLPATKYANVSQGITITPTGDCTFNASGGVAGSRFTLIVTTSGTTSRTLTFGTNFKSTGTLATGTVTAKVFTADFFCKDGTTWVETARTAAM